MFDRAREAIPPEIAKELKLAKLDRADADCPAYQRNEYQHWIKQAKRDDTREKRTQQMLAELRNGGV